MQIKRYFGEDMRQAIRMVREAQGPDAVILSNRKVPGGVEIVAAVDYDESAFNHVPVEGAEKAPGSADMSPPSAVHGNAHKDTTRAAPAGASGKIVWSQDPTLTAMRGELSSLRGLLETQLSGLAWGDLGRRHPHRAALLRRLMELDLGTALARGVVARVPESADPDVGWRTALGILAHRIYIADDDLLNGGGVFALVGPTGVGKTTTIAKLAARFALRHGPDEVALVTTDTYRVGATEQLRTYARIMGVPVRITRPGEELGTILDDLSARRLVLIDTAGMSQRDIRLSEQLAMIREGSQLVQTYLVLAASSQELALEETVRAFRGTRLDGCVITKLDEATTLGGALSVVVQAKLKVAYVSNGQRVPEDLRPARASALVTRAVTLMQQKRRRYGNGRLERDYGGMAAHGVL